MAKNVALRISCVLVTIVLLLAGLPQKSTQAATLVSQSFREATAPGWDLLGTATLTSGVFPDTTGNGWLRLTDNSGGDAGSAIYNTPFSSADGVQVTFTYATYGGTGADGFTFYLIDGSTTTPTVGMAGGALGYASVTGTGAGPGVTNGYVGIGFDEFGNFTASNVGACTPSCPGPQPNSISVRGSGSLSVAPGFNYLTRAATTIGTTNRAGARQVRITITPSPTIRISVEVNSGSGFVTLINGYNLSSAIGQGPIPATFKMGFSGSTGGSTNYHEIRDLVVASARPSISLSSDVNPSMVGNVVLFTAQVTGDGAMPTGQVKFYNNDKFLGDRDLNAQGFAYLVVKDFQLGNHQIIARYGGDTFYGPAEVDLMQIVAKLPETGFAPGKITLLPKQPEAKAYSHTQEMWLEIPKLKVNSDILGVPVTNDGWDVSWLGTDVGWLEGTAYPTSAGNSALSAHVWNADNTPGVFNGLDKLVKGDKVIVHSYDTNYIYQVQSVSKYTQYFSTNTIKQTDDAWLTLITCRGYNENTEQYEYRVVVKAKLVEVK